MIKRILTVFAIGAVATVEAVDVEPVKVLTDANFEHLTQAATGATTGTWAVKFFAPWCGHCKKLAPTWEQLADKLSDRVNVAHVDCTENKLVCNRMGVRGYPTLIAFHKGKMYKYSGNRSLEDLEEFFTERFLTVDGSPVPEPPATGVRKLVSNIEVEAQKRFGFGLYKIMIAVGLSGFILVAVMRRMFGTKTKSP